jgi:hypothetical protein
MCLQTQDVEIKVEVGFLAKQQLDKSMPVMESTTTTQAGLVLVLHTTSVTRSFFPVSNLYLCLCFGE